MAAAGERVPLHGRVHDRRVGGALLPRRLPGLDRRRVCAAQGGRQRHRRRRLSTSQPKYAQLVPAAGSLLAIPFWAATLTAPSLELSLAFLFGEYLFAECWFGPTIAALQRAAPPAAQGTAQGLFNTLTLVGNLAPAVIGYGLKESSYELPSLLIVAVPVLYAASAAAFYFAADATARAKADAA